MPIKDKEENRKYQREWKRKKKDWFWTLKETLSCENCGFSHPATLQFHHSDEKYKEVGKMVQQNYSKDRILSEIKKCKVLCANCHAVVHFEEDWKNSRI